MPDKYLKEIEEILKRADEVMPKEGAARSRQRTRSPSGSVSPLSRLSGGRGFKISAGKLMLASFALLLLALVLGAAGIVSVFAFVVAGLVLFVIAYALFFIRPGSSQEKRWRGRVIEESPSMWNRFRRIFKG